MDIDAEVAEVELCKGPEGENGREEGEAMQ